MKQFLITLSVFGLVACGAGAPPVTEVTEAPKTPVAAEPAPAEKPPAAPPSQIKKIVTVEEFYDYNCGYCRRANDTMQALKAQFGDQLRVELKHFNIYPKSLPAHRGTICAEEQGQEAAFHTAWFDGFYGRNSEANTRKVAEQIGLDLAAFDQCLESERPDTKIATESAQARQAGARGTPHFRLNGTLPIRGLPKKEAFAEIITRSLE